MVFIAVFVEKIQVRSGQPGAWSVQRDAAVLQADDPGGVAQRQFDIVHRQYDGLEMLVQGVEHRACLVDVDRRDRFVAEHFTTGLRPSDNIFRFGYPGCYLLDRVLRTLDPGTRVRRRPFEVCPPGSGHVDPDADPWKARQADMARRAEALDVPMRVPDAVPWTRKAHELVALTGVELPPYYSDSMDLLVEIDPESRPALKKAGLLTRDTRKKKSKKYGLKTASKAPQLTKP